MKANLLIGAGVEKCGTTSLFSLLADQQGFVPPTRKETRFFAAHHDKGIDHYLSLFDRPSANDWLIDISPAYFRTPETYQRIKAAAPDRLAVIFLIRNPLKRAFSQYWHVIFNHVTWGGSDWNRKFRNFSFHELARRGSPYFFTRYADHIRRVQEQFGEQALVGIFEELVGKPKPFLSRLRDMTETKLDTSLSLPHSNEKSFARLELDAAGRLDRIDSDRRDRLSEDETGARTLLAIQGTFTHQLSQDECEALFEEHFADDMKECEDLLGRDMGPLWKQSPLASPLLAGATPRQDTSQDRRSRTPRLFRR